jgi:hypothetical protein
MPATPQELDMTLVDDDRTPLPKRPLRNKKGQEQSMTPKQLRARARRSKKGANSPEFKANYKPIEEWDHEELARGRPRDKNGGFSGRPPAWISRELHEESMTRFKSIIKDGLNAETNTALMVVHSILTDSDYDDKGKPLVPASTKLDAAKFLIEHAVGKPTQRQETDISVKLQGILATSIITPGVLPAMPGAKELTSPRSTDDIVDAEWAEDDDLDEGE